MTLNLGSMKIQHKNDVALTRNNGKNNSPERAIAQYLEGSGKFDKPATMVAIDMKTAMTFRKILTVFTRIVYEFGSLASPLALKSISFSLAVKLS